VFRCVRRPRRRRLRRRQRIPLIRHIRLRRRDPALRLREQVFPRDPQVRHPHNVQRQRVLREPRQPEQERCDRRGHRLRKASDSLPDPASPVNLISSVPARRKACARQRRPARFVPAVRRDPEVLHGRVVLPEDFRRGPAVAALDRNRSAVSVRARPVEFRKRSLASRSTRASRPLLVDARPSKSVTQKGNAAYIQCARARVRLRAAHMWRPRLRSSANPAQ
jgi:hypothetical protein